MKSLAHIFKKVVVFLNKEKYDYMVIGGIASSILGYPRFTEDIDITISIKKSDIKTFLTKIKKEGFSFDRPKVLARIRDTGTFQIEYGEFHIDFIIVSINFEKEALSRKQIIRVYGADAPIPTPEDLIILKIVPGRYIDMADIENIAKRYHGKLDKKYLRRWTMKLSDEAEDMRIFNEVEKLLKAS